MNYYECFFCTGPADGYIIDSKCGKVLFCKYCYEEVHLRRAAFYKLNRPTTQLIASKLKKILQVV